MSYAAHSGPSFRSNRKTAKRKFKQGVAYDAHPPRYKVPAALQPFLNITPGSGGQQRAQFDQFALAIRKYQNHQLLTGAKGGKIVTEQAAMLGDQVSGAVHPGG